MHVHNKNLMTQGSVPKKMVHFAMPIFLGQLFQQLYNTADSLIVGNFIGSRELAAVSSSGFLIFLFISFFSGLFMGAGVVIANYIGAEDKSGIKASVHTMTALGITSGLILTAAGTTLAPVISRLMDTPEDVMDMSVTYFRIYFSGSLGLALYNSSVGILQASGDSKHPLYFLIISSILNILLDLIFIGVLNYGVGSAALATIISQFTSAVLCLMLLTKTKEDYRLSISKISFTPYILKKIVKIGIPSGLQNSIIGFANVIVQSNINRFGSMAMAGHGSYAKIEGFAFLPITSFCMAMTTFIGQNTGACLYDRVKKGCIFGTTCAVTLAEFIGIFIFSFAPNLISAFDSTPQSVMYGVQRTHIDALFYFGLAFSHSMAAIFRGHGKSVVPMFVMLVCWCFVRVSVLSITGFFVHDIRIVCWIYPVTWTLSSIAFLVYFILRNPLRK